MKFQLVDTYRYWWPIIVRVPDPNKPGDFIEQTFKVQFEAEDREVARARAEEIEALPYNEQQREEDAVLFRIIKNWDEVETGNGPLPFSVDALREAISWAFVRTALYRGYAQSLNGEKARLGN